MQSSEKPRIRVVRGSALPAQVIEAWMCLRRANPALESPFLAAEFTQIVAAARDDVEVAVVEGRGDIVALLPYQRGHHGIAEPVGGVLSDQQALICAPDFAIQPQVLLRGCGLAAWDFSHLLARQAFFRDFHRREIRSPVVDLSTGFGDYAQSCKAVKKEHRKFNRIERQVGPLRFVRHSPDPALLEKLLSWKSAQCRRSGWQDVFSVPWIRTAIVGIHRHQTGDLAGTLSVLSAGEEPVAARFGMRSGGVWHVWISAYDTRFAAYSPGLLLLIKMLEAAPVSGVRLVDLGYGKEEGYKCRFMNGAIPLAQGSVEVPCLATATRRIVSVAPIAVQRARSKLAVSPAGRARRWTLRAVRGLRRQFNSGPGKPELLRGKDAPHGVD